MRLKQQLRKLMLVLTSVLSTLVITMQSHAADSNWQWSGVAQGYYQTYNNSTERQATYNAGIYLSGDYLESANVSLGYNYTYTDFAASAKLAEHLFYVSGRRHYYPDELPGKLTGRIDLYIGQDTLQYPSGSTPPTLHGGHKKIVTTGTIKESTNIFTLNPQLSYLNYAKTLYADIGYAYSKYDGEATVETNQLSPAVGFGWNESYDWLQLRGYFIKVKNASAAYTDDQFNSLEAVYTRWFSGERAGKMEFVRFSALMGDRVLAVDPDAAVIYSTADIQTSAYSASVQWALSQTRKVLALVSYAQYQNDAINNKYDSVLFYLNLQQQL